MSSGLNFLLLLDTSGSMYGEKIHALNLAVSNFLAGLKRFFADGEPEIALLTFGGKPQYYAFAKSNELRFEEFKARGRTYLSEALMLARTVIRPRTILILFSDGLPGDGSYARILRDMALGKRIFAVGIGYDADMDMLGRFTGEAPHLMPAPEAEYMAGYILKLLGDTNETNNG